MVDRYTKVVLTIIAVGLWVQVGLQLNPVRSAVAELSDLDSLRLQEIQINTDTTNVWLESISYKLDDF